MFGNEERGMCEATDVKMEVDIKPHKDKLARMKCT